MKSTFLLICLVCLSGCAGRPTKPYRIAHEIIINSYSKQSIHKNKYLAILPRDQNISNSFQYHEFSTYLQRTLEQKGYNITSDTNQADILIYLKYETLGPENCQRTYHTPVYETPKVINVNNVPASNNFNDAFTASFNNAYATQPRQVGTQEHIENYVTYTCSMNIGATIKSTKEDIWLIEITNTSENNDLRRVVPVMLAGAKEFIGKNSGQKISKIVYEDTEEVLQIKGTPKNKPLK